MFWLKKLTSLGGSEGKESSCNAVDPGSKKPLEKGMFTLSSILAWTISWTEETGRLQWAMVLGVAKN